MITGHTRVFGVLGHPVRHSQSPAIHNALFAHHGIDAVYLAFEVPADRGRHLGSALRTLGLEGVNLTVPLKAEVLPDLDEASDACRITGAANVVTLRDGRLIGDNTDAEGFARAVDEGLGVEVLPGADVVILGAGGAARAIAAGVAERGASRVSFHNRSRPRADEAVQRLSQHFSIPFDAADLVLRPCDLVVNATSGGAADAVSALSLQALSTQTAWVDINYWMPDPPQLARARARGMPVLDGMPMLLHQAALSFQRFVGIDVDPETLRAVCPV